MWFFAEGSDSDVATIQSNKEIQRLRKTVKDFKEENNLLKYKIELLLDMVIVSSFLSIISNLIYHFSSRLNSYDKAYNSFVIFL